MLLFKGSQSVTYHSINEESRRYFNQTLVMSTTIQPNGMFLKSNHRCLMRTFAREYNNSIGDSMEELIQFLKQVPEKEIIAFTAKVQKQYTNTKNGVWLPSIEGTDYLFKFFLFCL